MYIRPIIICGGIGERLWPLSRKNLPKQFLNIFEGKSLFELTIERLSKFKNILEPIVVTAEEYAFIIKDILEPKN